MNSETNVTTEGKGMRSPGIGLDFSLLTASLPTLSFPKGLNSAFGSFILPLLIFETRTHTIAQTGLELCELQRPDCGNYRCEPLPVAWIFHS